MSGEKKGSKMTGEKKGQSVSVLLMTSVYLMSYAACETVKAMCGPSLEPFSKRTGISIEKLSQLPSFMSLGSVIGLLGGGFLFDRPSVMNSESVSNLIIAVAAAACGACHVSLALVHAGFVGIVALTTLLGACNGVFRSGTNLMVLRLNGREAGPYMQALHLFGGAGRVLAPLALRVFDLEEAYVYTSTLAFAAGAVLYFLAFCTTTAHSKSATESQADRSAQTVPTEVASLVALAVYLLLMMGTQNIFQNQIAYFASTHAGLSLDKSLELAAVLGISFTGGRCVSVVISTMYSPKAMLTASSLGVAASTFFLCGAHTSTKLFIGTAMFGVSISSIFASTLNLAKNTYGAKGKGIAIIMQVGSAGAVIAPILMVNTVGSKGLLNLIGVMVVMANITFFFLTTFRTQDIKSK